MANKTYGELIGEFSKENDRLKASNEKIAAKYSSLSDAVTQAQNSEANAGRSAQASANSAGDSSASAQLSGEHKDAANAAKLEARQSETVAGQKAGEASASAGISTKKAGEASASAAKAAQEVESVKAEGDKKIALAQAQADRANQEADRAKQEADRAKGDADKSQAAADKSNEIYEAFAKGAVYRGGWNPVSGAYPDPIGVNSYWDVYLVAPVVSFVFDGITWYSGDRLIYSVPDKRYFHITRVAGVLSVDGLSGAVNLSDRYLSKGGGELSGPLAVSRAVSIKAPSGSNPVMAFYDVDGYKRGELGWNRNSDMVRISKGNTTGSMTNYLDLSDDATISEKPIYEGNARVYSPSNPPTPDVVGTYTKAEIDALVASCSSPNICHNPDLKINQRNFNGNWSSLAIGDYGYDQWMKVSDTHMAYVIEEGFYNPNQKYTVTKDDVLIGEFMSPTSGHFAVSVPFATSGKFDIYTGQFKRPWHPVQDGLSRCQRYYENFKQSVTGGAPILNGQVNAPYAIAVVWYAVTKRKTPSFSATPGPGTTVRSYFGNGLSCCNVEMTNSVTNATARIESYTADASITLAELNNQIITM